MTAVLLSVREKSCDLIISRKKTMEVRKGYPRLDPPFKCYIYKTKTHSGELDEQDGRVIGEYICTGFFPLMVSCSAPELIKPKEVYGTGMTDAEIIEYLGNGVIGYGWNITQLKIYDTPKELREFRAVNDNGLCDAEGRLIAPPQTWAYVEDLG